MTEIEPRAWFVLVASVFALCLNSSTNYAIGIIHIALLDNYPDEDVTKIAWLGSLFSCMFAFTGVLASVVINMFNARTCVILSGIVSLLGFGISSLTTDINVLFISFGLIAGCGQGLCHTGTLVSVGYYFRTKTSMATGIALSGCGLTTFIFPPLVQHLLDTYGLQGAFLLLGGVSAQATVCGAIMKPTKYEIRKPLRCCSKKDSRDVTKDALVGEDTQITSLGDHFFLLKSKPFVMLLLSSLCFCMSLSSIYLFLPDYFKQHGSTPQEAAFVMSVAGITGIFSRLLLGFLASAIDVTIVYSGIFGIMGTITLFLKIMTSLPSKILYTALYGFYVGGCFAMQYVFTLKVAGLEQISSAYGIVMMVSGTGYLIGPPIAEILVLRLQDSYYAFVLAAMLFYLSSILGLATSLLMKDDLYTPKIIEKNIGEIKNSRVADSVEKIAPDLKELLTPNEQSFSYIDEAIDEFE